MKKLFKSQNLNSKQKLYENQTIKFYNVKYFSKQKYPKNKNKFYIILSNFTHIKYILNSTLKGEVII